MEIVWSDKDWQVVRQTGALPDGRSKTAIRVKRPDAVHLLAFPSPKTILILREFRPFYGTYIWMLPSGRVDKEKDIMIAAQRELQEETGYRANDLKHYCTTHASESCIMKNDVFIAKDLVKDPLPQDADELIEVHALPLEEALHNVLQSKFVHTVSAYAILRYLKENC